MATIAERFWSKVDVREPDECWHWLGRCDPYGSMKVGGKHIGAHVVSFELKNGFRPSMTCHSCDNPPCCNPSHLFAGDALINQRDMASKGRANVPHKHPMKKLTKALVSEIRKRYVPRTKRNGTRALAREFCVSHQLISLAVNGKRWNLGE